MAKAKSEERKLAEQIAKQRGIKVKSAYRQIQRGIKAPKEPKASGLSKAAAAKLREFIGKRKAEREPKPEPVRRPSKPQPVRRRRFDPDRIYNVPVRAQFRLYGSGFGQKAGQYDNRKRQINLEMKGYELEDFLAAESEEEALEILTELQAPAMRFLIGAEVSDLRSFTVEGQTYGSGYFEN
jgi:hypothetical protein